MTSTSNIIRIKDGINVQQEILKLPQETQNALTSCIAERGILTTSIPIGLLSALASHRLIVHTKMRKMSPIFEVTMGFFGYVFTRIIISGQCVRQYLPNLMQMVQSRRMGQDYHDSPVSSDSLENPQEQDASWNSFDTFSSDSGDQFPTTNREFEEEDLTADTRANVRKTVTYEQLRNRNRASHDNLHRERNPRRNARLQDDSWSSNAESNEKNIWG